MSRLCGWIDDTVSAVLGRPIEGDGLYLWIDATYANIRCVKVRQNAQLTSVEAIVTIAVKATAAARFLAWISRAGSRGAGRRSSC